MLVLGIILSYLFVALVGFFVATLCATGGRADLEQENLHLKEENEKLRKEKVQAAERHIKMVTDLQNSNQLTCRDLYKKDSYINKLEKSHMELEEKLKEAERKNNELLSPFIKKYEETPKVRLSKEAKEVA